MVYQSFFRVEILKGTYSGQKLMKLVNRSTIAIMPSMMAAIPDILSVR
jgi:hypothetical protein